MMGLFSWVSHEAHEVAHGVKEIFDPDTSRPSGADPHQIYQWFHAGPGTGSYQSAADAMKPALDSMKDYTSKLNQAKQALAAGWTGSASDAAQQSFEPINQRAQMLASKVNDLHTQLSAQIGQFNETKSKVVNVPQNPPSGPGIGDYLSMLSPATIPAGAVGIASADSAVSSYQSNAHANQAAYQGYQGPTNGQVSGLPHGEVILTPQWTSSSPGTQAPTGNQVHLPTGGVPSTHPSSYSGHMPSYSAHYQAPSNMHGNPTTGPNMPQLNPNNPNNLSSGTTNAQGYTPPSNTMTPPNTNPYGSTGGYPSGPAGSGGSAPSSSGGFVGGYGPSGSGGGYGGGYGPSGSGGGYETGNAGGRPGGMSNRSGVGGVGAEEEGGLSSSSAAAARGATGEPGMGGVGGRGGRKQDDQEHKTASYLQENDPNAIFGTDEKTVPPVIGL